MNVRHLYTSKTFKCQRRPNTAMPGNSDMTANTAMAAVRQKSIYGNIAESELLCVRVATLLRNKLKS